MSVNFKPRMTPRDSVNDETGIDLMKASLVGAADPEIVSSRHEFGPRNSLADTAALDELIGDGLLFTGPDGELGVKARELGYCRAGSVRFFAHEPEELRVRRVGADVAVTALRARLAVEVGGVVMRGTYRYTRVWAREDGGPWRVVGGHVSEVRTLVSG